MRTSSKTSLSTSHLLRGKWFLGLIGGRDDDFDVGSPPVRVSQSHSLWMSESWTAPAPRIVESGDAKTLVLGAIPTHHVSDRDLEEALGAERYEHIVRCLPASNVVIDMGTTVVLSSDVPGLRPVYARSWGSRLLYSSSALLLKHVTNDPVSSTWLASYFVSSDVPDILQSLSPYENVRAIPPAHFMVVGGDGVTVRRYWRAPEPTLALHDGARGLRDGLTRSVERRIESVKQPSADLSGGFDSTTIALIAASACARTGRRLPVVTGAVVNDPRFDDLRFATEAAASAGNIDMSLFDMLDVPGPLDGLEEPSFLADEPSLLTCTSVRFEHLMRAIRELQSDTHLSGQGGDAVLEAPRGTYLPDLLAKREFRKLIRHARETGRATRESSLSVTLHAASVNRLSPAAWYRDQVQSLAEGQFGRLNGWGRPPRRPSWLTKGAFELAAEHVFSPDAQQTPHGSSAGQHCSVASIISTARACRLAEPLALEIGVDLQYPFFDTEVINCCLAIKPEDRTTSGRLKPLIAAAFRDELPNGFFERPRKTSPWFFTRAVYQAIDARHEVIQQMFQDPILGQLGLVEAPVVRRTLGTLDQRSLDEFGAAIDVMAAEVWLRRLSAAGEVI